MNQARCVGGSWFTRSAIRCKVVRRCRGKNVGDAIRFVVVVRRSLDVGKFPRVRKMRDRYPSLRVFAYAPNVRYASHLPSDCYVLSVVNLNHLRLASRFQRGCFGIVSCATATTRRGRAREAQAPRVFSRRLRRAVRFRPDVRRSNRARRSEPVHEARDPRCAGARCKAVGALGRGWLLSFMRRVSARRWDIDCPTRQRLTHKL
jgi:hypothetical protein